MRIAVVTSSKSLHTRVFVEYLVERGHDVTVITNRDRFEVEGVRTVNVRPLGGRRLGLPDSALLALRDRAIAHELARGDYDVVNVQMLLSDGVAAALASPVPVVITLYGSDVYRRDALPAHYLANVPQALGRATVIHACSHHMAEELVRLGAPAERIAVFQYGIDLDRFVPLTPPPRPQLVVSSRALRPLYRVHLIAEAMPAVLAAHPDARLAIFDTGDEEDRIRATADALGVQHAVEFLGRVDADRLAKALGEAAVWVSMAESDGTPLSLLEAMAAGAFPVVAELDTLHEWLSPSRAVMVSDPSAAKVANAVIEALGRAASGEHIEANRTVVAEHGDRAVNLPRFEELLSQAASRQ